jgi:hypothetical protein
MRPVVGPWRAIGQLAESQGGVVGHEQLRALGLGNEAIKRRIAAGWLLVHHRTVYAVGHRVLGPEGSWWAAVLACGPTAVLSHASAAHAWDIRRSATARVHVTIADRSGRRRPGIAIHRPRALPADEVTTMPGGLPITTPARTLIDIAADRTLRGRSLERAIDGAELGAHVDWADVARLIDRYPRRAGVPALRSTLELYTPASVDTRSRLEEIMLGICARHGIPRPQTNVVVEGRVRDFYWPHARLVVEADGYRWHRSPGAFNDDRERDTELALAGYERLRFTYDQCTKRRHWVRSAIHRALGRLEVA